MKNGTNEMPSENTVKPGTTKLKARRDAFAAAILPSVYKQCRDEGGCSDEHWRMFMSLEAYDIADAMIKAGQITFDRNYEGGDHPAFLVMGVELHAKRCSSCDRIYTDEDYCLDCYEDSECSSSVELHDIEIHGVIKQ